MNIKSLYKLFQHFFVLLLLLACNSNIALLPDATKEVSKTIDIPQIIAVEAKSLLFSNNTNTATNNRTSFLELEPQAINTKTIMGELGKLSVNQQDKNEWHTISLTGTYTNPVVIMQSPSANDTDPVVIRLRNVASDKFEFQLQEWDYQDGKHDSESISYMVVESGRHHLTLDDGTSILLEADLVEVSSTATEYYFEHYYPIAGDPPVVFTQSQTVNEASAIITRQELIDAGGNNNIRYSGITLKVEEEEANESGGGTHIAETVGVVVIEQGNGVTHGSYYAAAVTDNLVNHQPFNITFPINLQSSEVIFLSSLQTENGGDTAALRYSNLSQTGATVYIDEEQSANVELAHTEEVVGYLAFQARFLSDDPIAIQSNLHIVEQNILEDKVAELGQVLVSQESRAVWHKISTLQTYTNPVVILQPASYNGSDPATYRLRNVTVSSFEFQLQEWDYQDGNHPEERLSYMVAEVGHHVIDSPTNSLTLNVAKLDVNSNFATHDFTPAFTSVPIVLTQSQTVKEADAITVNLKDISTTALTIRLQEEEANGTHTTESVGYIALTQGSGVLNPESHNRPQYSRDTKNYVVGTVGPDSDWKAINFPASLATPYAAGLERISDFPFFLAGIQTTNGGNTASLRYRNLSYSGSEVFIEDEQSRDSEQHHIVETVGYAVFDSGFGYPLSTPLPAGWQEAALNGSVADRLAIFEDSSFHLMVVHSGSNDAQAINYVYQNRTASTTLEACMTKQATPNADDKGGIMLRSDNDTDAFYAYLGMTSSGITLEYRSNYTQLLQRVSGSLTALPTCVRLIYDGSSLRGFESQDGATWAAIGGTIPINLGANYTAGLSASTADFTSYTDFNKVNLSP